MLQSTHLFPVPSLSTHGSQHPMCHPSLPFDYSNIKCSFDLVLICSFDLYDLAETPTVSFFCVWLQVWSASHYCVHKVLDLTQQTFTSISWKALSRCHDYVPPWHMVAHTWYITFMVFHKRRAYQQPINQLCTSGEFSLIKCRTAQTWHAVI